MVDNTVLSSILDVRVMAEEVGQGFLGLGTLDQQ